MGTLKHILLKCKTAWIILVIGGFVLVCRSEGDLAVAQKVCQEMSDNLRRLTQDKQTIDLRTAAELDDLYRTKINLEERLVELIR